MSRDPYRVIVWGPGYTGRQVLRELIKRPEFDVVGCLAYSQEKDGADVGVLAGQAPIGVTATTNQDNIVDLDADVVIYAGRLMIDTAHQDAEVARLLRSGKNVVAATAYHFPWQRGQAHAQPLEEACRDGGVTLLGTGIHPGWFIERVVPLMTGLCMSVDRIDMAETVDLSHHSGEAIRGMGYGLPPERLGSKKRKWILSRYYFDSLAYLAFVLGVRLERVTSDIRYRVADKRLDRAAVVIEPGTVASISGLWTGYVSGKPYLTLRERLYLDPSHVDTEITSPDFYDVHVSGQPLDVSTRVNIAVTDHADVLGIDDAQCGANLATAVQLVQTIPAAVDAPPGILLPQLFAHCASDFRDAGKRDSSSILPVPEEIL
jgi:4-hydroxy-tetrahydrodipicolinate reductase